MTKVYFVKPRCTFIVLVGVVEERGGTGSGVELRTRERVYKSKTYESKQSKIRNVPKRKIDPLKWINRKETEQV